MGTFSKQRIWIMVIVLVVLVAAAGVIFYVNRKGNLSPQAVIQTNTIKLNNSELPIGIPVSFPLYGREKIIANANIYMSSQAFGIRDIESPSTTAVMFGIYRNYFKKNGWNVNDQTTVGSNATAQEFIASKGTGWTITVRSFRDMVTQKYNLLIESAFKYN